MNQPTKPLNPTTAHDPSTHPDTAPTTARPPRPRHPGPTRVPLSVWLTEPLTGCCPICEPANGTACAHRLTQALARRIIETFTRRGDHVYVPEAGNAACLVAAVKTGRKVTAAIPLGHGVDPATDTPHTHAAKIASLAVLRRARPGTTPAEPGPDGTAQLTIAAPHTPTTPARLAALTTSCAQALKPGGVLVVTTRQSSGQHTTGHLVAHARAAGLVYLQHIAAVEATAIDDRLIPTTPAPVDHRPGCQCHPGSTGAGRHLLVHHDLLAFTKP